MKLCSRLLIVLVEISGENDKCGYVNPILGKIGMTHDRGCWLVGKPMIDFPFALINFFAIYYGVMRRNVYNTGVFTGVDQSTSLHSNFTWTGSSSINHSWQQKSRDTGLYDGKDRIISFWQNTGVWRTDGQIDGYTVAYTALAKLS